MSIAKTVDKPEGFPGDTIIYTLYYNNTGTGTTGKVWVNDTLPNGVSYLSSSIPYTSVSGSTYIWEFTNLAPGSYSFTITAQISTSATPGTTLTNNVVLQYQDKNGNLRATLSASVSTTVLAPAAAIVINEIYSYGTTEWLEIANPTSSQVDISGWRIYVGNTRIYTFPANTVLGAFGSGSEYLTISLTNDLPNPGGTVSLRLGDGRTIIDMTTYPRLESGESWARFKAPDTGLPVDTNNDANDFYISQSPTPSAYNDRTRPLMTLSKVADKSQAQPGELIIYTIYYNNTGDGNAGWLWLNDTLPSGVTFISSSIAPTSVSGSTYIWALTQLAPGTYSLTITVRVEDTITDGAPLTNSVTLDYKDVLKGSFAQLISSVSVTGTKPNIAVQKIADKSSAAPGEFITYTIYYNNTGQGVAKNVWVNDTLPSYVTFISASDGGILDGNVVRWQFSNVPPGTHFVTLVVQVNSDAPNGYNLVNTGIGSYSSSGGVIYSAGSSSASTVVTSEFGVSTLLIIPLTILIFVKRKKRLVR